VQPAGNTAFKGCPFYKSYSNGVASSEHNCFSDVKSNPTLPIIVLFNSNFFYGFWPLIYILLFVLFNIALFIISIIH
jgi:hypothetical protein